MKPIFSPTLLKTVSEMLLLVLLIKVVWFAVEVVFLPATGIDHIEQKRIKPLYYRVKLTPNRVTMPKPVKPSKPVGNIKDIVLLGIYSDDTFTVVTIRYKGKSKVLGKGESVNGFTLERAGATYAVFSKDGKEYKITLKKGKEVGDAIKTVAKPKAPEPKKEQEAPEGDIVDAGDHKIIDRSLLDYYGKHLDKIYENIGIQEIVRKNKIEGFRVSFVKRGSLFSKLGLRRGDVLKAVNGEPLTSYKAAFDVYKNINEVQNMTLLIQRGKQEMELEYEVN